MYAFALPSDQRRTTVRRTSDGRTANVGRSYNVRRTVKSAPSEAIFSAATG
ncbi:MAG: hypothetical protein LBM62_07140 [Mediterranea sp.]|nr:hypothetical protein [Mediterranea sp.]